MEHFENVLNRDTVAGKDIDENEKVCDTLVVIIEALVWSLLSNMILFRLRHAVDKVLREEQCGFRKGRGCVDHVCTLRLIIEKSLRCQTPLVLSFIDYEQAFDSVDRTALTKVMSLYGIHEKCIKVICAMYENNTAAVKVGNEVSNWFCIKSGVKQGCVSIPLYMDHFDGLRLKKHRKDN